jgi:hypothetical protein
MKVYIVHESQTGNGARLAEAMEEVFVDRGATVTVGHVSQIAPERIGGARPDVLILGGAVRGLSVGRMAKEWMSRLSHVLGSGGPVVSCGVVFLTHWRPRPWVERRGERVRRRMEATGVFDRVYPKWISGRVAEPEGPFLEGIVEQVKADAAELYNWAVSRQT